MRQHSLFRDFLSRRQAMLADGFREVLFYESDDVCLAKFRHSRNRRVVILRLYPDRLVQLSQGRVVYDSMHQS